MMNENTPCYLVRNEQDLNEALKSLKEAFVLFYASWCPFCKKFLPIFERQAEGKRHFVRVQDDQETLSEKYAVEIYPTILFFENASISRRLDGVAGAGLTEGQLSEFVRICTLAAREAK